LTLIEEERAAEGVRLSGCSNFCAYPLCGQGNLCGGACPKDGGKAWHWRVEQLAPVGLIAA